MPALETVVVYATEKEILRRNPRKADLFLERAAVGARFRHGAGGRA
jgi:hypothetical protein